MLPQPRFQSLDASDFGDGNIPIYNADAGKFTPAGGLDSDGITLRVAQILTGEGAPTSATGINGDFYLDQTSGNYYSRAAGTWTLKGNLKGAPGGIGDKGPTGDKGPQGDVGNKGLTGDKGPQGNPGDTGNKGPVGDQGPTGEKGATGDKGPSGDKGLTGDKGATGNTGATGEKGLTGDVGNKGPTGDKGLIGDKGPQGDVGAKGPVGDKGVLGDKGPQGDVGEKGPTGDKGPMGDQGTPGNKGPQGDPGNIGNKGPTGDQGPVGVQGDKGPTGDKGVLGDKGLVGDKGPQGDVGNKGPQGDIGDKGPVGDKGAKGDVGDKGLVGDKGPQGSPGDVGNKGPFGDKGPLGDRGAQGPIGDKGPQGDPGLSGIPSNDAQIMHLGDYTSPVNPIVTGSPYDSLQSDFFWQAYKRFSVTGVNLANGAPLYPDWNNFFGYNNIGGAPLDPYSGPYVITIDITAKGEFPTGMPYYDGFLYLTVYGSFQPLAISTRIQLVDGTWINISPSPTLFKTGPAGKLYRQEVGNYGGYLKSLELHFTPDPAQAYLWISKIEYQLTSPQGQATSGLKRTDALAWFQDVETRDVNNSKTAALNAATGRHYARGDYLCDDPARGLVLKSPNGHYWRLAIGDDGTLNKTDLGTVAPS